MSESGKVRQITKIDAKQIDPKKVAYFTLNDGTVFIVKDNLTQENVQIPQEQITTESDQVNIQTQQSNIPQVPQQESNYKYYISSGSENVQMNSPYFNAKLINARIIGNNQINFGQGKKRQLYKLIEAIPVRFYDEQEMQYMNQSTNSQNILQQNNNNTNMVEKTEEENIEKNQINTQSVEKICNCKCNCEKNEEKKCCCPIGCPEMRENMEIVSEEYYEQCMKQKKEKEE